MWRAKVESEGGGRRWGSHSQQGCAFWVRFASPAILQICIPRCHAAISFCALTLFLDLAFGLVYDCRFIITSVLCCSEQWTLKPCQKESNSSLTRSVSNVEKTGKR